MDCPNSLIATQTPTDEYHRTTDPKKVDRPVNALVHPALINAWEINNQHSMPYIFDAVDPARKYKRSMRFDEDADCPVYGSEDDGDVTETNGPPPGLMEYMPHGYR